MFVSSINLYAKEVGYDVKLGERILLTLISVFSILPEAACRKVQTWLVIVLHSLHARQKHRYLKVVLNPRFFFTQLDYALRCGVEYLLHQVRHVINLRKLLVYHLLHYLFNSCLDRLKFYMGIDTTDIRSLLFDSSRLETVGSGLFADFVRRVDLCGWLLNLFLLCAIIATSYHVVIIF